MKRLLAAAMVVSTLVWAACSSSDYGGGNPPPAGGGAGGGAAPSGGGGGGGSTTATARMTLSSTGANPTSFVLAAGSTLEILNTDAAAHEMSSDPHPSHTNCPQLNGGSVAPGGSVILQVGETAMSCGMHDQLNPQDTRFRATVQITGATPPPPPPPPVGGGGGGGSGGGNGGGSGGGY